MLHKRARSVKACEACSENEETEYEETNQFERVRTTAKQGASDTPSLGSVNSSSKKRAYPASVVSKPTKKPKIADCTTVNPSSTSSSPSSSSLLPSPLALEARLESPIDRCYWEEWDIKREEASRCDPKANHFIKAVQVWDRLDSKLVRFCVNCHRARTRRFPSIYL